MQRRDYHLQPQALADALRTVSRDAGKEIIFSSDAVKGRQSPAMVGSFTLEEAIRFLIDGTGLVIEERDDMVLLRGRGAPSDDASARPADTSDIIVTGSRIRGAKPSSPVITLTAEALRTAGRNDLGEAIRALPQNFNGGQNPGVTFSAGGESQNFTSGSSLNLRGLGADASLTLLNGHRMAYDSATQAIDISSIPLAAVDRVEIVADGASALYGSDAVGGVANIILKKDFDGLDTRARLGTATDGGFLQQQYSLVAGKSWRSGNVMVAADHQHSTDISARQRSYTAAVPSNTTLYPGQDYTGVVLTGRQHVTDAIGIDVDGYYSRRTSKTASAYTAGGFSENGTLFSTAVTSMGISPRVSVDLDGGWHADVRGTIGREKDDVRSDYYIGGTLYGQFPVRYTNRLTVIEASVEGGLVDFPAGTVRLAAGGGYRSVGLLGRAQFVSPGSAALTTSLFDNGLDSYFGYGELFVPIVATSQGVSAISSLSMTAAGRFERYDRFGSVFTPKIGIIYSPVEALDIKGSWGRSFKAPTLYQVSVLPSAVLSGASDYAANYPDTATVLYSDGGRPDLRPERATTWSATVAIRPFSTSRARFEISYFNVKYRDRVLMPLGPSAGALTNPLYADLITFDPTDSQIASIIARAPAGLINQTGSALDPASVVAIVDNRYRNVARYRASGMDVSASVPIDLRSGGVLTPTVSASYLDSAQQTNPGGASVQRAGRIFYPPHLRTHVGLPWTIGDFTVAPAIDYIGRLTDARSAVRRRVGSMTTADLTIRYVATRPGVLSGVDVSLSALNVFNAKPASITVPAAFYPAYDSANFSPIGRSLSLTIGKKW